MKREYDVELMAGTACLEASLSIPVGARGLVVFAHGSGSSRFSPRNRHVAARLREAGLGTLLLDLLSAAEERAEAYTGHLRFDIGLLARRLVAVVDGLATRPDTRRLPVGCFGASTGAAAALVAAALRPRRVGAVVSRGGRPDLAGDCLSEVRCPTLLVVGSADVEVLALNEAAQRQMQCVCRLEVVPGASHLFEEPGALDQVATLAAQWFRTHLTRVEQPARAGDLPQGWAEQPQGWAEQPDIAVSAQSVREVTLLPWEDEPGGP